MVRAKTKKHFVREANRLVSKLGTTFINRTFLRIPGRQNGTSVRCSFCGKAAFLYFRTGDLNRRLSRETFDYYRCPGCGLVFLNPIPADLGEYYPPDYYSMPSSLMQLIAGADAGERYKIEIVRNFASGGRLLEIGPAVGGFAYLAKQAGFDVATIEMDTLCCQFLTDVVGVRAINSDDVPAALIETEPYDVIALWHVIEHLLNPWETISAVAERLVPGGIVVIAAPNPAAFQFRVLGRYWTHVDAPRHVQLIPVELLIKRAGKLGLKTVMVTTTDRGALGWNVFGWRESLSNFLANSRAKRIVRRAGNAITKLVRPIERSGLRGSTYTVVLRKDR